MSSNRTRAKILGFINEDTSSWVLATLVFSAGAVLTALLALANVELYQRQLRQRFELLAAERISRVQDRLEGQIRRLDGLRRFFMYSNEVSEEGFNGFSRPLLILTQAYSWAPKVLDIERSPFELQAREDGHAGYSVRELSSAGELVLAGRRPVYYPVRFSQSRSTLALPFGFDLSSEPVRRATLERALRSRTMAASPRIDLVGLDAENRKGILLVAPVFPRTLSDLGQPGTFEGFLMAVISMRTMMTEGLPPIEQDNLALTLDDVTSSSEPTRLYDSAASAIPSELSIVRTLDFAGRRFQVQLRPTAVFAGANPSSNESVIILGALLSFMISALLYVLISQRQRAIRLVEQRTLQLRQREQELRSAHSQLTNVLEATTQVAIIATDLDGVITTFNIGAEKMLGYSSAEVSGVLTLRQLHLFSELADHMSELSQRYGRPIKACEAMLVEAVEEHSHQTNDWTFVRRDGSHLRVNMQVSPMLNEHNQWVGYLAVCVDITERKRVEEELRTMSVTDALTGVFNRRYFQERLQAELSRVGRYGGAFAVVMLDIDHFKRINDQLGHAVGDRVLQAICQRLSHRLRGSDVFCRLGGEEFMILCPDTDGAQAYGLATELRAALRAEPVDGVGQVTASFGIASWREGEGGDSLLVRADAGVYAAKMAGRDRIGPERV
ncbi:MULTISPECIES: diguanylate cyclase [unclassified Pseudomonas]|uniref:sensor domain-containing diguanylate cyclase n=1 Tax=unclassified Pseudomonas TaxID=196821 RepID=UPI000D3CDD6A|nr:MULTISPECIES: diguanylate cyclase [unclassified Pseudomonas]RAU45457.1 diguanylate cyclase [Pseudomonas sp. RIT 409]RAU53159.1 diguanylate cyclase [Pseudomonas sp. RIT 412]